MANGKNRKIIVLSGINLYTGGPLTIYYECLDAIRDSGLWRNNKIVAFVHRRKLFEEYEDFVTIVELPKSRKNYLLRLYYEFVYFNEFSKRHRIDVWISLHDITPRVKARRIYTYCHNAIPFLKKDLRKIKYGRKEVIFSFLYKYLYRLNITSATAIIVQQDWMRKEFKKMYPVENIIVARPIYRDNNYYWNDGEKSEKPSFIYAAYPRFFKNYEVILDACEMLEKQKMFDFEVWITIDGTENNYSKMLKNKYKHLKTVKWYGLLSREEVFEKYNQSWYMIFPSTLETWGLPISEYKQTQKPMIVADLPYAHETVGRYDKVIFFDPSDYLGLVQVMKRCIEGSAVFKKTSNKKYEKPICKGWDELIKAII